MKEVVQEKTADAFCETDDFAQILGAREGFYGFLAQSYLTEPNLEFLSELSSQIDIIRKNDLFHKGADLLNDFFEGTGTQFSEKQGDLAKEFVYLFVAPGGHRVHPCESVHRSKKRLLKQEPFDQVVSALRETGLGKREECKELEDHISLEFEYMEILCGDTMRAFRENEKEKVYELLERQRLFLVRHILRWVPEFCRTVYRESKTQFYQGIALITEAFISSEKAQIDRLKMGLESLWPSNDGIIQHPRPVRAVGDPSLEIQ